MAGMNVGKLLFMFGAVSFAAVCGAGTCPPHVTASLDRLDAYAAFNPRFDQAFAFLRRKDLATLPPGRYEIDGSNCWAMVQDASLTPMGARATAEVHRSFIDIQAPLTGAETFGLCPCGDGRWPKDFDAAKDVGFFESDVRPVTVQPGQCAIFFPKDGAHAPGHCEGEARTIRKVVVKVRADDAWTTLFDGKTLDGWRVTGGENKFAVEDGCIVGTGVPSDCGINTFLVTEKEYADFDLTVEFQCDSGNSGVQFRSHTREKYDPALDWSPFREGLHKVYGYQAEITPDGSNTGRIYDEERRGYRNGLVWLDVDTPTNRAAAAKAAFRRGGWNEMRVRCQGPHIQTWLNGQPVADFYDDLDAKGFIGLQMHLQKPPKDGQTFVPGVARFRNVRLRELPGVPYAAFRFPRATPESQGILSEAVMRLVDRLEAEGDQAHSYMLVRHGKVVAEGWWRPYDAETRHALFSVSKAFVSMGIGFAAEDRLLSLNDRIVDFFPDQVPSEPDARMREMRVRDLLAMASGQTNDASKAMLAAPAGGQVRSYYATLPGELPGRRFRYLNGNTAMLAQIHRHVTGADDLIDYLRPRLFDKIGIVDCQWARQPDDTALGCSGFELRTEDLAKVAQLLLQEGRWNGVRILPLWWVKQATSCQTPYGKVLDPVLALHTGKRAENAKEPNDWEVGYGYQLWMGRHETFRLCGAKGQIAIVMPSEDLVFVSQAGGNGANALSVNAFYDTILPELSKEPLAENPAAVQALRVRSAGLTLTAPKAAAQPTAEAVALAAADCAMPANACGIRSVRYDEKTRTLEVVNGFGAQKFKVGKNGAWKKGLAEMEADSPWTLDRMRGGFQPYGASGGWTTPTRLEVRVAFTRSPYVLDFAIDCAEGAARASCRCRTAKRYCFGEYK